MDLTTPDGFRAWLAAHDPDTVVGHAASPDCCPLQRYTGADLVDCEGITWDEGDTCQPLSPWAQAFIVEVDDGRKFDDPITAAQALACLEAACEAAPPAAPGEGGVMEHTGRLKTIQDAWEDALVAALIDEASARVAAQGVEIHQWLRDEKARKQASGQLPLLGGQMHG